MKKVAKRIAKILGITIGAILALVVLLVLLVRLPAVQNFITQKATGFVSAKTHTELQLHRLYIGFPKMVVIEGLYAGDSKGDTLLSLQKLAVNIDMLALLKKKVSVTSLELNGANANILRGPDSLFNFNFFIDAFASKDTTPKPEKIKDPADTTGWQIDVGKVKLENIRARFYDEIGGTEVKGYIGSLNLNMKAIDIKHLNFEGNELALANADVTFEQSKHGPEKEPDTSIVLMPLLSLNKLDLEKVKFKYKDQHTVFTINAGKVSLLPDTIDLNEHIIKVNKLHLENTQGAFAMQKSEADTVAEKMETEARKGKGWQIGANELKLDSVDFNFDMLGTPHQAGSFDYNHIGLQNVHINIANAHYSPDVIYANIKNIALREQSGVIIKQLTAQGVYDDKHIELMNLTLETNHSRITNALGITYNSISTIANNLGDMGINANFNNTVIAVDDILKFAPQIKDQPILAANRGRTVRLTGKVTGKLNDLTAPYLRADVTGGTMVAVKAHIKGLPDALNAFYDVTIDSLHTSAADINLFSGNKIPASVRLPNSLSLAGKVKGSVKDATANLHLRTSAGGADIDAKLKMAGGDTVYTVNLQTHALDIGYILKQDTLLGPVTIKADVKGRNFNPATMSDSLVALVESVQLRGETYNNINITATADSNVFTANIHINDTAIALNLSAAASFVKGQEFITANAAITNANLQALNLVDQPVTVSGNLLAESKGPVMDLNARVRLGELLFIKGEDAYRLDSLVVTSQSDSTGAKLQIESDLIVAKYDGNVKLPDIPKVLVSHIDKYFTVKDSATLAADTTVIDSMAQFRLSLTVMPHPILTRFLAPKLENFTGASLVAIYNRQKSNMDVNLQASSLAYAGIKAQDVSLKVNSNQTQLGYDLSLKGFNTGPVRLTETSISGIIEDNNIGFALRIHGSDTLDKLRVGGDFRQDSTKSYALFLDNDRLIIGNERWNLTDDNYIRFGSKGLYFNNFKLNNNTQALSVVSDETNNESIKADFNRFELKSLSQIIEDDTAFVRGVLDGFVEFRNLKQTPAFVSDLTIKGASFKEYPIGDIALKADNLTANKYMAQLTLTGSGNDVHVIGSYSAVGITNALNFKVDIDKLNLHTVEPFTAGQLRRSKGYLTGKLNVTGAATQPVIAGDVYFKDAAFNLAYINNYLRLKDEHIAIDGKGIYFRRFTILDSMGQKATLAGAIYTSDFKKMRFDANLTTNNFTVMNTTIKDNQLFFGRVLLSSDISVKGNEELPVVDVDATLLEGSNISVVLPSGKISTDRGEGVVLLIDSEQVIINDDEVDTLTVGQLKGIKLKANLTINSRTSLKLIVDKSSGDSLVVRGEGRLSFNMNESGNQNLVGTYYINSGAYRATFQKVVKRILTIQPGGYITFNGSPTDAIVDVTAVYSVKTPPADLLSTELASSSAGERNVYKKPMNFRVLMSMKGELLKPEISFKLDMDEADQNAFGGTVYSKITSLNNDPSELNKQVFALIVLNKFIPAGLGNSSGEGDGYATAATNIARSSLNQVLTDQINALSGRYIKFVDLSVGIDNNDEYTTAGTNQGTQVSVGVKKSFFKERLTVQVGTSVNVQNNNGEVKALDANNLTGDIVIEYKINADGSLRFKAFRENQYEGLIDGSLYKTGVGVVVSKDYDSEKEIFRKKTAEEKAAEKEQQIREKEEAAAAKADRIKAREERKKERAARKAAKKAGIEYIPPAESLPPLE